MVRDQIEARGIREQRVLIAMRRIERHRFIPVSGHTTAYEDGPQPIGFNQTISQPYIVALMTELLNLNGTEKILEIGTGSGYQTAVLAETGSRILTIEIIPELSANASAILSRMDYQNITLKTGDGYQGWPDQAPFDRIIITAAPPEFPDPLLDQLAPGGIMVVPVGVSVQDLMQIKKNQDGTVIRKSIIPVRFVPMIKS